MALVAEEAAAAWPGLVLLHCCQTFHWVSGTKIFLSFFLFYTYFQTAISNFNLLLSSITVFDN